jgi:hypothetical protein
VLEVYSFEDLKSIISLLNYKVGILIDKAAVENKDTSIINKWLVKQINYPIIVVGYGNPTYIYFKKLLLTEGKEYIPSFSEETYVKFKKEKGFSLEYIGYDGKIYGKGYKGECNIDSILEVLNKSLVGEENVKKMIVKGK